METDSEQLPEGSLLRGAAWMFALSLVGINLAALGLFLAGAVGGIIAKRPATAVKAALLPAIFWTIVLILASKTGVKIGGQQVWLPMTLAIIPALSLFGGALMAATGTTTRIAGLALGILGGYVAFHELAPIYQAVRPLLAAHSAPEEPRNKTCPENLKQLHKAILIYADSWDNTLPPADRWTDLIKENVPDDRLLHCPSIGGGPAKFGYAMNSALGGKKWQEVKDATRTPLFYDSSDLGPNAHDDYKSVPSPGRHAGRNNVIFLDGHVGER